SVTAGGSTTAQHFRASVPVRNPENGHVAGQLSFTLDQGMAVSQHTLTDNLTVICRAHSVTEAPVQHQQGRQTAFEPLRQGA
ncbi:hypothetical protein MJO10_33965, partial [Salmonella enterica subsp. enterica serovar Anatum]|nr:hypothetical protein [Salmonella enterica subsp. enterica serovar Anatum]